LVGVRNGKERRKRRSKIPRSHAEGQNALLLIGQPEAETIRSGRRAAGAAIGAATAAAAGC